MRALLATEFYAVAGGGDVAPTCSVTAVRVTGSNGNSTVVYGTTCSCQAGTTLTTTTSGQTVTATCKE